MNTGPIRATISVLCLLWIACALEAEESEIRSGFDEASAEEGWKFVESALRSRIALADRQLKWGEDSFRSVEIWFSWGGFEECFGVYTDPSLFPKVKITRGWGLKGEFKTTAGEIVGFETYRSLSSALIGGQNLDHSVLQLMEPAERLTTQSAYLFSIKSTSGSLEYLRYNPSLEKNKLSPEFRAILKEVGRLISSPELRDGSGEKE